MYISFRVFDYSNEKNKRKYGPLLEFSSNSLSGMPELNKL